MNAIQYTVRGVDPSFDRLLRARAREAATSFNAFLLKMLRLGAGETADADKPFDMRSYYSNDDKANVYDAEAYLENVEAHSGAVAATKLASEYTSTIQVNATVNATVVQPTETTTTGEG